MAPDDATSVRPPAAASEHRPAGGGIDRLRTRLAVPAGDLAWLAVAGGAVVLVASFAWLAPPLADLYPSPTDELFPLWRILIDPEPLEDVRSMLALATPVLLAGVLLALGTTRPSRPSLDPFVISLQVVGVVLLVIAVLEQPRGGPLLAPDYFDQYLLSAPNLIAGIVIGMLLAAVALRPPSWRWLGSVRESVGRASAWRWVPLAVAILVTAIWLLPAVNTDDTVGRAGFIATGHIPVQGDDYFAAVNGRTPLVDYISQYANLLPLVLEPLLKAVGPSITSVSISMCVLSAIGMVAIYGAFVQVTRGAWSALALYVPWVALSLFPWNDVGPYREFNGIYNGVMPARYFGPFLLALLCAISLRTRRVPTYALFLFAGLVLLNNYEFGIAALLALIAAVMAGWDRALPLRHRLLDLLLKGGAGLITAIALVSAITLVRAGELPDPALLTYYNRLFLRDSYGLQPMSSLGLHWALYATYAAALLIAAVRYVRAEPDRVLTGMLAFSAIFGLVTGMYFVGRSSQFQLMLLFPAWGLALALLAWTAAHSLRSAALDRTRLRRLLLPASVALAGFGVMVSAIDRLPQPQRQIDRLSDGGTTFELAPTERYIESVTQPGEDVLLIGTAPDHLVADRAGVVNVSPLNGVVSLFSPKEADRGLDQLEDDGGNVVIERTSALPPKSFPFSAIPEFATILRLRGYALVGENPALLIRVWRRESS
jgi:hypothetical protein